MSTTTRTSSKPKRRAPIDHLTSQKAMPRRASVTPIKRRGKATQTVAAKPTMPSRVSPVAEGGDQHAIFLSQSTSVAAAPSAELFHNLRGHYRRRQDFLMGKGDLERRLKAITRRLKRTGILEEMRLELEVPEFKKVAAAPEDDEHAPKTPISKEELEFVCEYYDPARTYVSHLKALRAETEKATRTVAGIVSTLSIYESFWAEVKGLAAGGLAMILAESGNLSNYSNPGKLWKRFGLHPHNGRAGSTWRSHGGLSAEGWTAMGYSPVRRSIMFQVVDSLLKHQKADAESIGGSYYRTVYDERKAHEQATALAAGLVLCTAAEAKKRGLTPAQFRSPLHIHRRCHRFVAKRLLRELWRAWRDAYGVVDVAQAA